MAADRQLLSRNNCLGCEQYCILFRIVQAEKLNILIRLQMEHAGREFHAHTPSVCRIGPQISREHMANELDLFVASGVFARRPVLPSNPYNSGPIQFPELVFFMLSTSGCWFVC